MSKVWGTSCEASQLLRKNDVNIWNNEMHQTMHLHFSVFSTSFVLISWRRVPTATKNLPNVQGKEVSNSIQAYSGYVSYKTHQNSLDVDQTTWPTRHRICMEHLHPLVHWSINIITELAIQKVLRDNRNRHCETSKLKLRTTLTVDIKYEKSQSLRRTCGHIHDAWDRNDTQRPGPQPSRTDRCLGLDWSPPATSLPQNGNHQRLSCRGHWLD